MPTLEIELAARMTVNARRPNAPQREEAVEASSDEGTDGLVKGFVQILLSGLIRAPIARSWQRL
jgi:hypothetical protein